VIKLLVVDDSALMRRLLTGVFAGDQRFEVQTARDGLEALQRLRDFKPDVITLDLQMPQMDGLACLKRIMLERPCPVVIVSSLTEAGGVETLEALEAGAIDFIPKPAGAMSLSMDEFAPVLLSKILTASAAKIPAASKLVERVRLKLEPFRDDKSHAPSSIAPGSRLSALQERQPIVLVGCSTGGPPALEALLSTLPDDFPWAVVVAQHMPRTFTGPLASRLDRACKLNVREVTRAEPVEPGTVLIARGDADLILTMRSGNLVATSVPASENYRWHPSVDRMVSSAMKLVEPRRLVGVLMTGMGDDGAAAMCELAKAGGRTIAEHEDTAVVWGMPGALAKRGGASRILPLHDIATELVAWTP
jgi:two-component system, chemotaxis family, protein-glutamate methylesterase/glutaminase